MNTVFPDHKIPREEKININRCIKKVNAVHKQRLLPIGPLLGMAMILFFALALLPLYLYLLFFNVAYFWIRRQKPISRKPYFHFDRHKVANLRFADMIWCEYCEWANGSLQWALAITNEIERRYCPIKNACDPHCDKAKEWRVNFLDFYSNNQDVEDYYAKRYLKESNLED